MFHTEEEDQTIYINPVDLRVYLGKDLASSMTGAIMAFLGTLRSHQDDIGSSEVIGLQTGPL